MHHIDHSFWSGFLVPAEGKTIHTMKRLFRWLLSTRYGSNNVSYILRKKLEHISIREVIGVNLAGVAFFGAVILPQTQDLVSSTEVFFDTQKTVVNMVISEAKFRWPLAEFGISQYFSGFHGGVDLTDPQGTPVYPIAEGTVTTVESLPWGYGKHVIIKNSDSMQSTYAHLSEVDVTVGQKVTKNTEIGEVGATGWATGNHLHLEIHMNGASVNPLEILPEIQKRQSSNAIEVNTKTLTSNLTL